MTTGFAMQLKMSAEIVDAFGRVTGDFSPIHFDSGYARLTRFRSRIVHGMLPVLCVLACSVHRRGAKGARLQSLSCRFVAPAHVGDVLKLELDDDQVGGVRRCAFRIVQAGDGSVVTTGNAEFAPAERMPAADFVASLVSVPVHENALTLEGLKAGHEEAVKFVVVPAAVQSLLQVVDSERDAAADTPVFDDASLSAALMISTLVGMRLPGRYATFLEFNAVFSAPAIPGAGICLTGKVEKIFAAGGRMQMSLDWMQNGAVIATGNATTMVGAPGPAGIRCAEIKSAYLANGVAGKVALVTGASRGIGEAAAKLLAMHGAKVAVHYFHGRDDAQTIVADISGNGGMAIAVGADLADEGSVAQMFESVEAELGPVDILVNNAVGSFTPKATEALGARDYLEEFNVSLFGMHACCKLAIPHMRSRHWGKIINMGTVVTEVPVSSQNKYITAKSAVVGYTRSLAAELAADNIQVNIVVPGMTETTLIAVLPQNLVTRIASDKPGGKLLQPIEVAQAILFLASDMANSISGQKLVLNQGEAPFI